MKSGPTTARINSAPSLIICSRKSRTSLRGLPTLLRGKPYPARRHGSVCADLGKSLVVPLRPTIEQLLELSDEELKGPRADELEDAVQRALTAVHVGELWICQVTRALDAAGDDPEHRAALEKELA